MITQASTGMARSETKLRTLIEPLQSGSRPKGGVRRIATGVPSIGGEHLTSLGGFRSENAKYVPRSFYETMKRGRIRKNDVLVVKDGATTGKVALVRDDFPYDEAVVNEHVFICRPLSSVDPRYLFWYLFSPEGQQRILENFQGSAQGGINQSFADNTSVPLLPLPAQQRIADRLEALNSAVSATRSRIAVAARRLSPLETGILADAYETATSAVDDPNSLTTTLRDLLSEPLRNGYSAVPVPRETPYRVLTLTATTSGWFDGNQYKYTEEEFSESSDFWVQPGDILIQRGNTAEYVGVPAVYEGPPNEFIFPDLMIRARIKADISTRYVWYMMLAPQARDYVRSRATGSAGNMPKINQGVLLSLPLPLPPEDVRAHVVERLDAQLQLADELASSLEKGASHLEASFRSALREAFER